MSSTNKHLIKTYLGLFEGLSSLNKIELIESLSKSLKIEKKTKDDLFHKSFGAFSSKKSAEEIIKEINRAGNLRIKKLISNAISA